MYSEITSIERLELNFAETSIKEILPSSADGQTESSFQFPFAPADESSVKEMG